MIESMKYKRIFQHESISRSYFTINGISRLFSGHLVQNLKNNYCQNNKKKNEYFYNF